MGRTVPLGELLESRRVQSARDTVGLEVSGGSAALEPEGRLDVVIVNYETPDLLDDCLRSIKVHSATGHLTGIREIIVVDNSGTPDGAELVVRKHSGVRLLRSTTNVGYGSAANRGIASGGGEYALVLNADAHLREGAVEALIEELDLHLDTAVVGPRLVDDHDRIQASCARFPTPGRVLLHETGLWRLGRSTKFEEAMQPFFDLDAPDRVPWVLGAALAVRRQSFDAVGGFDPRYFMYYEEVDLCRRLAARGMLTRFTPAATIVHVGGASTALHRGSMRREMFRSLARYTRLHGRDPGLVRLRLAVIALACARFGRDVLPHSRGVVGVRARHHFSALRSVVGDAMRGWPDE